MERTFKFSIRLVATLVVALIFAGCGLQTAEQGGTYDYEPGSPPACTDCEPEPDAGLPADVCEGHGELPPPVQSDRPWELAFHLRYLPPDTNTVQVVGNLPGMTWQSGIPAPCQGAECTMEIPHEDGFTAGMYEITYVRGLPGEEFGGDDYASYGKDATVLSCMPNAAQDWIDCKLEYGYDGSARIVSCGLQIYVSATGEILAAGNMTGFDG